MSGLPPRDAATVIVARDGADGVEVLLLRRSSRASWLSDVYVFPGGAVDASDRDPAALARLDDPPPGVEPALVVAAARETFEEAGLLFARAPLDPGALAAARATLLAGAAPFAEVLAALDARIDGGALVPYSRWVTPAIEPRRFDARFFIARAPAAQHAEADANEVHEGRWVAPRAALAERERGAFALIFPTIKHLERVAAHADVAALLAHARGRRLAPVTPSWRGDPPDFYFPEGTEW